MDPKSPIKKQLELQRRKSGMRLLLNNMNKQQVDKRGKPGRDRGIGGDQSKAGGQHINKLEEDFNADTEKQFEGKIQYLCYGDLIMLNYTRKIFNQNEEQNMYKKLNDIAWDGESVDEHQQLLMDDQDRKENVKLQRLIE